VGCYGFHFVHCSHHEIQRFRRSGYSSDSRVYRWYNQVSCPLQIFYAGLIFVRQSTKTFRLRHDEYKPSKGGRHESLFSGRIEVLTVTAFLQVHWHDKYSTAAITSCYAKPFIQRAQTSTISTARFSGMEAFLQHSYHYHSEN